MTHPFPTTGVSRAVGDVVASAAGTEMRADPVRPRTGGPAGNARLTAWVGLLLLVGFLAECATLLSLHAMVSAHIFIGAILVPLVLLKTATTGWRILRYYAGAAAYRIAGPPPLLLRLLGPLVVVTGIAVLGSGLALIPLGQSSSFTPLLTVAGQRIDPLTVHKICFVLWLVVTGAHVLARTVPAVRLTGGQAERRHVPGRVVRTAVVAVTLAASAVTGVVVVNLSSDWTGGQVHRFDDQVGEQGASLPPRPAPPGPSVTSAVA